MVFCSGKRSIAKPSLTKHSSATVGLIGNKPGISSRLMPIKIYSEMHVSHKFESPCRSLAIRAPQKTENITYPLMGLFVNRFVLFLESSTGKGNIFYRMDGWLRLELASKYIFDKNLECVVVKSRSRLESSSGNSFGKDF